ncbi:hypothetical protein CYPRO_0984 [Cyclonatronum proteinivorum]|uniref:Uncharacterized protein n=1 Tax=Cyclonatronum proteinivorum TaxID=1457365 RepID=A0A345UIF7_9BACT|nr:hypothetical protein CYPRO_0984 [Cyclonatronum proteinivorum]
MFPCGRFRDDGFFVEFTGLIPQTPSSRKCCGTRLINLHETSRSIIRDLPSRTCRDAGADLRCRFRKVRHSVLGGGTAHMVAGRSWQIPDNAGCFWGGFLFRCGRFRDDGFFVEFTGQIHPVIPEMLRHRAFQPARNLAQHYPGSARRELPRCNIRVVMPVPQSPAQRLAGELHTWSQGEVGRFRITPAVFGVVFCFAVGVSGMTGSLLIPSELQPRGV